MTGPGEARRFIVVPGRFNQRNAGITAGPENPTVDPVRAKIGSLYLNHTTGAIYKKDGTGNTDWIELAEAGGQQEQFFTATNYNNNSGDYRNRNIGVAATFRFTFSIPEEFQTLVALELIGFPNSTGDKNINLNSDYAAIGEDAQIHSESNTITPSFVNNQLIVIDISSVYSQLAAGDFCGLAVGHVDAPTAGISVRYLGVRLKYLPV